MKYIPSNILIDIVSHPRILKMTKYSTSYPPSFKYDNIDRVESYYMERRQKFTWLKKWNNYVYIYGDALPQYNFGI
jgi:hypothetical protein